MDLSPHPGGNRHFGSQGVESGFAVSRRDLASYDGKDMKASVSADQLFNTSVGETWETIADIENYPNRTSSYTEINPLTNHLGGQICLGKSGGPRGDVGVGVHYGCEIARQARDAFHSLALCPKFVVKHDVR